MTDNASDQPGAVTGFNFTLREVRTSVAFVCYRAVGMKCEQCKFYRSQIKRRGTKFNEHCTPTEFVEEPTGQGECMLQPPSVQYRQAAVDRSKHWAGERVSVVEPGFKQSRPVVLAGDFCGSFQSR